VCQTEQTLYVKSPKVFESVVPLKNWKKTSTVGLHGVKWAVVWRGKQGLLLVQPCKCEFILWCFKLESDMSRFVYLLESSSCRDGSKIRGWEYLGKSWVIGSIKSWKDIIQGENLGSFFWLASILVRSNQFR
jgi:hypothetical protein